MTSEPLRGGNGDTLPRAEQGQALNDHVPGPGPGSSLAEPCPGTGSRDRSADDGPPSILVADDDEDILSLVALRLERAGYHVRSARDGEQALRIAVEEAPDLAILDVMMPRLTGLEVTQRIRDGETGARLPVILLTARAEERDMAAGIASGADDYIRKPFSPRELRERVEAIVGPAFPGRA